MRIIGKERLPVKKTFLAAIREACVNKREDLRVSLALPAILMDRAGLGVDDLKRGVTCIEAQGDIVELVQDLLRWIYSQGNGFVHDASRLRGASTGNAAMVLATLDDDPTSNWLPEAVDQGVPVVLAIQDGEIPGVLWQTLIGRSVTLGDTFDHDVVNAVIAAVTGDASNPVPESEALDYVVRDLKLAIRRGTSAEACHRVLRKLVQGRREQFAAERAAAAEELLHAPAEPVAVPVDRVIKKLSEMTGFGKAGEWGIRLAEDVKDYVDGLLSWEDLDKGALVYGPPGSGKTTFARSLALECGIEIVPVTYADWQISDNKGGDSTAKNMTRMMENWRAKGLNAPIILFIDEIDTMGSRGGNGHNDSWFRSQINTWLAFLDGAQPREGVIVIGATNHPDMVDPAMLRPGRLDRSIELPYPDAAAMEGIVRTHLRAEGDLRLAAKAVRGRSPAEIERMCREARRVARRVHQRPVEGADLVAVARAERPDRHPDLRRMIAVHEAAHAVAALDLGWSLDHVEVDAEQPLARIKPPATHVGTRAEHERHIVILLAGRAAEDVVLDMTSTGPTYDLRHATEIARDLHTRHGVGHLGTWHQVDGLPMPEPTAVMQAIRHTLDTCQETARSLVRDREAAIRRVAAGLERDGYLDGAEVRRLVLTPLRELAARPVEETEPTPEWYPSPRRVGTGFRPRMAA